MAVETHRIRVDAHGDTQIIDLSHKVQTAVLTGVIRDGIVTVFVVGSTAAITTTEFEPGLVNTDFKEAFERIAPLEGSYQHERTWNDDNGHAHIRAAFLGPSLTVPLIAGRLTLGSWQQIVLMDFDTRPRHREIVVQVIGQ
jgi:secondary thiamine-phosphate synthase enzyme